VKAVVLVGGQGTRLRPLTYTTPKSLLPIANRPFLERQLEWLIAHGVDDVVLSLGYLPESFRAHFPDNRFDGLPLRWAVEPEPLGTAGGIRFAADRIDERIVVCNGDVLTSLDLTAMVRFHDERHAAATIALAQVDDPSAFGVVPTKPDGEVIAFVEKPPRESAPSNWINAGTYVLEPEVLAAIPTGVEVSIERETFPALLDQPGRMYAMQSDAYWLDIGTPEKYLEAHADVLAGRLGMPPVSGAREVEPGIWMEGDVARDPSATLIAPVLLGADSEVGAGARVESSVVGPGCVVAPGAEVERAVLLPGTTVDGRVADVVVGADAVLEVVR
jgi:mannose-1-phosphate guanylyltransferase